MSMASLGVSDAKSDYSNSIKNSPAILENCTYPEAQIHELEKMHEEIRAELGDISSPRVLFSQPHELNPTELANK